jgi:hypothetical protein
VIGALASVRAGPRRALIVAAVALALPALALAPGGLGPVAARAGLVAAALGAAALVARRRPAPAAKPAIAIISRASLARDAGVAIVEAGGRRLLVGYGSGGVQLLSDAPAAADRSAP